ncbi:MAG TPA: VOC family protein [Chitinophagales bacterium]|nr:VOC family protein [Chitinophagales bacterium]
MPSTLFKRLVYIYTGTNNYSADYHFYKNILGAKLIWEFENFGAKVAAFDLCGEPYLLIADHVHAPGKRLIYEVENINAAAEELKSRGWKPDGKKFEVPDGPCINFNDESGNEYAIIQMTRPHVLEKEYKEADSDQKKNP